MQTGWEKHAGKLLNAFRTLPLFFFLKERRDYLEREALPLQPSQIRLLVHEQQSQSLTRGHACTDRFWTHQVLLQR